MNRFLALSIACVGVVTISSGVGSVAVSGAKAADDVAKTVLAVQLRKQGFACSNPKSASRDSERSKADSKVWVLSCENATYRVRVVPNMAAKVQRLDLPAEEASSAPTDSQGPAGPSAQQE